MRLKEFESKLQQIASFSNPKILLEQYVTSSEIAAHILYMAQMNNGDIDGKNVADLGCGPGVFTIGCSLLNAGHVIAFEIDSEAIDDCRSNIQHLCISDDDHRCRQSTSFDANVSIVQCDVTKLLENQRLAGFFDTVILNPPFGTKRSKGIDLQFLRVATYLSRSVVYSLHKSATRQFVVKKSKEWLWQADVIAELNFDLPQLYRCHRKESVDIAVDCIRFEKLNKC